MNPISQLIPSIESKINYTFKNPEFLALAFIHRSFANENRDMQAHNERLEFLGDSVLGLIASQYVYEKLPNHPEGELSYLKSRLVEAASCVSYIQKLNIAKYLALGRGEKFNEGRGRDSILADLFEALIGAIFLDSGFETAKAFFLSHFKKEIELILETPHSNWKAMLQDHCQKIYQKVPLYTVLKEEGPEHSKSFEIVVLIDGQELGKGAGSSKKEAQQAAAKAAMESINLY